MNPPTHTRAFYLFLIAFLIIGPSAVFYAYGWRWDVHQLAIFRVGGIFLKGLPLGVDIKINGADLNGAYRRMLTGVLIPSLRPGKYEMVAAKEGYTPLTKEILVSPGLVSETEELQLIPAASPATQNR